LNVSPTFQGGVFSPLFLRVGRKWGGNLGENWLLVTRCWLLVALLLGVCYWLLVACFWMLGAGCWVNDVRLGAACLQEVFHYL
jgi:hypothetical protein